MAQKSDYDIFWQSVEKFTMKLDPTFCKMLWAAHFRMISSFLYIVTDEDLLEARIAIENTIKELKKDNADSAIELEKLLGTRIGDSFQMPYPFRMALKDVCHKLRQSSHFVSEAPCRVESSSEELVESTPSAADTKLEEISECAPTPSKRPRRVSLLKNKLPTNAHELELFDYDEWIRAQIVASIELMAIDPGPDIKNMSIVPDATEFPRNWLVLCPFADCSGSVSVFCYKDVNSIRFDLERFERHLKRNHVNKDIGKNLEASILSSNATLVDEIKIEPKDYEPAQLIEDISPAIRQDIKNLSKSIENNLRNAANPEPPKRKRRVSISLERLPKTKSEIEAFDFFRSIRLRVKRSLTICCPESTPSCENIKVEVVQEEFPKRWRVCCPFSDCKHMTQIYCYYRDEKYLVFKMTEVERHFKSKHCELREDKAENSMISLNPDSKIQIKSCASLQAASLCKSEASEAIEILDSDEEQLPPPPPPTTATPRKVVRKRTNSILGILPRNRTQLRNFNFEDNIRIRAIKYINEHAGIELKHPQNISVKPKCSEFPARSWSLHCPVDKCSSLITVHCYLRNGTSNFNLNNFVRHLKKAHGVNNQV